MRGRSGPVFNLVGEKVALGPMRKDLLPLYQRWINDLESARSLGGHRPFAFEEEEEWYARLLKSDDIHFTVYEREGSRPIGTASLADIDHRNRRAEFGILIGDRGSRNKGFGAEATRLMLDYAFTAVGMHNVQLRVFEFNKGAIRAYEKAGFKEYGRRREAYLMDGRMWDDVHVTTPPSKEGGFSANACVNYRYVSCRRPRPGLEESLSLLTGAVAQKLCGRTRSNSALRRRRFYRVADCPPEPRESSVVKDGEPPTRLRNYSTIGREVRGHSPVSQAGSPLSVISMDCLATEFESPVLRGAFSE